MDKNKEFKLNEFDREEISTIIKKGGTGRLISRALTLKMKDKNFTNIEIADVAEITPRTVINICNYYLESGLHSALNDDPRPGQPPKFDDRIKSQIIALICSNPPDGFDRWTLELLQEKVIKYKITDEISRESIRIILHEHDLKRKSSQLNVLKAPA
jgi:putative transposase